MFIAETLTSRFNSLDKKLEPLKFEYVETDPVYIELKAIANDNQEHLTDITNLNQPIKMEKKKNKISIIDSRTQILDSDDDEEEEPSNSLDKVFLFKFYQNSIGVL